MFCFQCQEALKNEGCVKNGICGKRETTSGLQDVLVYVLQGIALAEQAGQKEKGDNAMGRFITQALFATLTNTNFDDERLFCLIEEALTMREKLLKACNPVWKGGTPDAVAWSGKTQDDFARKAQEINSRPAEEDIRSLQALLLYGIKGIAAYAHHAAVLNYENENIYRFISEGLAATAQETNAPVLLNLTLKAGEIAVTTMALLDQANTETYGHPEITQVNIGVRANPAILISGHDLRDMEELLQQTAGTGIDVYSHGEMLAANYYPAFKKYSHFAGNYGDAWWRQHDDFDSFHGPVLLTTNCLAPPDNSYKDRLFTTGIAGYQGVKHIPERQTGQMKDFSPLINMAKTCPPPEKIDEGTITGGFARNQVLALASQVVEAVKSGAIKRFIVMAGCDGRQKERSYFTDVAKNLPPDTVILTAGCAKFRYNKLNLGDIGGIPRVLDAGQCNDCYSLAVIALALKDVFSLNDINDLPLSFDVAWYEQKAVAVLLALLHLGVKGIRLGPTLPAFLSPGVAKILVDTFGIKGIGSVQDDVAAMMAGK
jgi:hydroxylamine reductase